MCYENPGERRAGTLSNLQLREQGAKAERRLKGVGGWGGIFFYLFFFLKGTMNLASIAPESALLGAAGFSPAPSAGVQARCSAC